MSGARRWLVAAIVAMPSQVLAHAGTDALAPVGPQAHRIASLWWTYLAVAVVVWVLVVAFAFLAVVRRRVEDPGFDRRRTGVVSVAVGATLVTLILLLFATIRTGRAMSDMRSEPSLTIEVVGQQWWWSVRYGDADPSKIVTTANEIHIPVGEPVRLQLTSKDVIHSFWVAPLNGKKDLIPGHVTWSVLQADAPGVFEGQCAEFCGHQHAHMNLTVIAEPRDRFDAWLAWQRANAAEPADPKARRGRDVFLSGPCAMCHTIRGTDAGAVSGPDLTHLASRRTIAAGTLPNTPGAIGGWIGDPQHVKPGVRMPSLTLPADDLDALVAYLASLR